MENTSQDTLIDSPNSRQESYHDVPATTREASPFSSCSEATIKPLRIEPPVYTDTQYHDSPLTLHQNNSLISLNTPCRVSPQQSLIFHSTTHTEYLAPAASSVHSSYPNDEDDEDVPLAHLLLYPRDAPPAYSTVVRQSYRETLLQHIPRHPVVVDLDEEAGLERIRADDVRFEVERIVAMAVVIALLVLAGLLLALLFMRS